jgi:hypothetical protein
MNDSKNNMMMKRDQCHKWWSRVWLWWSDRWDRLNALLMRVPDVSDVTTNGKTSLYGGLTVGSVGALRISNHWWYCMFFAATKHVERGVKWLVHRLFNRILQSNISSLHINSTSKNRSSSEWQMFVLVVNFTGSRRVTKRDCSQYMMQIQ